MDSTSTEGQRYIIPSRKKQTPHAYLVIASLSHPNVSFDTLCAVFPSTGFPPQESFMFICEVLKKQCSNPVLLSQQRPLDILHSHGEPNQCLLHFRNLCSTYLVATYPLLPLKVQRGLEDFNCLQRKPTQEDQTSEKPKASIYTHVSKACSCELGFYPGKAYNAMLRYGQHAF